MSNSGGQVENAIVPPDLSTRSISRIATSGRGANMCPNWLRTTSNAPSGNGSASTSPSRQSTSTSATPEFSRARSSSSGVRSRLVTFAPMRAAVMATTPVPQATSSTRWPDWTSANFTRRAAVGVVTDSSGAKCAHPCFCVSFNFAIASALIGKLFPKSNHYHELRNLILRRITLRNETRFNNDVAVGLRDRLDAQRSTGARPRGFLPASGAAADSKADAESLCRTTELRRGNGNAAPDFFRQQQFWPGKDRRQNGRVFSQSAHLFQTRARPA